MIYTVTLNPAIDLELVVPAIDLTVVSRATSSREDAGGKGFNVSLMLHNLGCNNIALGVISGANGLRHALVAQPNVVKPNLDEAKALFGDLTLEQLCECFIKQGAKTVVISIGADGAVFLDGASNGSFHGSTLQKVIAPTITERSAIAAGDSFVAGLVSQLESGQSLIKACHFAAACGAATAAQPGTKLGSRAEIEQLAAKQ